MADLPKTDNVEVAIVYAALTITEDHAYGHNSPTMDEKVQVFSQAYQAIARAVQDARPVGPQPGTKKPL